MRPLPLLVPVLLTLLVLTGCGDPNAAADQGTDGPIALTMWVHEGKQSEVDAITAQIDAFNAAHPDIQVAVVLIPEQDYGTKVGTARPGDLPDLLDFDGPYLANYAWSGKLIPLDSLLPAALQDDLLRSIVNQGTWNDHLYGVGSFDSGLCLYADAARLRAIDARIPTGPADAWTAAEFDALLAALAAAEAAADEDGQVLDLGLGNGGEWRTYAFAPVLHSAGAALIDPTTQQSRGTLDSPPGVAAMRQLQDWITGGLVDPNPDSAAFSSRRVALSWSGHWDYNRFKATYGDDLLVLPLPDFGTGSRTGQGSWAWGITSACAHPEAAAAVLDHLLATDNVLALCQANGAVPATASAAAASPLHQPGGPLELFITQLQTTAVPRPVTPAYPAITEAFQQAFASIRNRGAVDAALTTAATAIDTDIADNDGYPVAE